MPSFLGVVASSVENFNPLDYTPVLWLDAADTSTITSSSGSVSQWDDKSGNGYHVTQSTGTAQPTTGTVTLNGRNVIDFDGTSDYLIRETDTAIGRNVTGMTIYIVVYYATNANNSISLAGSTGAALNLNRFLARMATGPVLSFQGRTLDSDSGDSVESTDPVSYNTWYTQTGIYDYANTDAYQYVNGVANGVNSSYQTATTTSDTDSLRLTVGINQGLSSTSRLVGSIAEIIIYHSAHTATERATVWDYLNGKWGL